MADTSEGRTRHRSGPTSATHPTTGLSSAGDSSGRADVPEVAGTVYGPHRGRSSNLILVRHCPHCGAAHRHTSELLADTYWRSCPVTGRPYRVLAQVEPDTRRRWRRAA